MATQSEIKKAQGRTNEVRSTLQTGLSFGTGALGVKAASKILPFLNQYIPEDLAYKGINKVMPGLGDFLKKGMKQGLTLKSGLDFLKNEVEKEPAKDKRNIIEQYSPELNNYISQEIKKGRQPLEAGALAQIQDKFKKSIKKMEEDHKSPFSSILQSIFGGGQQATQQPQPMQSQQNPLQAQQGQQMQQAGQGQGAQQMGPGEQALMQQMQMISQKLGL